MNEARVGMNWEAIRAVVAKDLTAVRRVYVTPESWDAPGSYSVEEPVEVWCFSCRTQYPHEEVP